MSNVLRCVALTALIMSMSAVVSMAATPYEAPKAVSTPATDSNGNPVEASKAEYIDLRN